MDDVKAKIVKLLNLSKSINPHEAAAALAKAHALMTKHQLDAKSLENPIYITNDNYDALQSSYKSYIPQYEAFLVRIIEKAFGVQVVRRTIVAINPKTGRERKTKAFFIIVGQPHRVQWAEYSLALSLEAIKRAKRKFTSKHRRSLSYLSQKKKNLYIDNFCQGFVRQIDEQLQHFYPANHPEHEKVSKNQTIIPVKQGSVAETPYLKEAYGYGMTAGKDFRILQPLNPSKNGFTQARLGSEISANNPEPR